MPSPDAPARPDDVLIITNGDSAVARLEEAQIAGAILPWRDVLHDGPAPATDSLEQLSEIRAAFISADLGLPAGEIATEFASRDAAVRGHAGFARVEIWLEHDLYDQLQLIQILDFFRAEDRTEGLYLVQADDYLGHQGPDAMRRLAGRAAPVTAEQFALAGRAWKAFTAPTPHALARLADDGADALPHLAPALRRLLAELPDPIRGLTLTEERALAGLVDDEPTTGELFRHVTEQDEAQFLGDASFFRRLDGLAFADEPLIEGLPGPSPLYCGLGSGPKLGYADYARARLKLTPAGRGVLSGRLDHRVLNRADHWVGGVHVSPAALIRYDRAHGQLVAQD
ncbi:hypothetical protein [Methylopila turkensis]|uniref:DUF1835 domain-containing protein n=1 Tax=Methylopila turkensis TaxID=1437816 RepID=A0A9W6JRC4_9HYPH|nr:hypothetical protein [Methylopila turkensis]GLK80615.1 hypothetical protein GCM10008174_23560 [Methylopila turkensis]